MEKLKELLSRLTIVEFLVICLIIGLILVGVLGCCKGGKHTNSKGITTESKGNYYKKCNKNGNCFCVNGRSSGSVTIDCKFFDTM